MGHWESWPMFHHDKKKKTVNYPHPILEFIHDENAYKEILADEFPEEHPDTGEKKITNLHEVHEDDVTEDHFTIIYLAEKLPIYAETDEENYKNIFKLLMILSETDNYDYFLTGYV